MNLSKILLLNCLLISTFISGCFNTKQALSTNSMVITTSSAIPYQIAQQYFIKNNVTEQIPLKITSKAEFEHYFGQAATMEHLPTPIDFQQQYVIVINHPVTQYNTEIIMHSLTQQSENIVISYTVKQGDWLGYQSHPFLLLIVSKNIHGKIILHQK